MSIEAMKWAIEVFLDRYSTADQVAGVIGALRHAIEQEEKREWVGLTDEEAWGIYRTHGLSFHRPNHVKEYEWALCMKDFAHAIEAKLKEKNSV